MEKTSRSSGNIFACLPKTSSIVSFANAPFSPGKEKRPPENHGKISKLNRKSFSGPIVSIIPKEARTKAKDSSFDQIEPSSPKVSCIGQIKHKKKKKLEKEERRKETPPRPEKKKAFEIKKLFRNGRKVEAVGRKCEAEEVPPPAAPALGQMKRFSSRRDAFANFDWKDPTSISDHRRDYYSDEERDDDEEDEEKIVIPFSCPIIIGGEIALEPRKEVNLWKRRTAAPPRPLELNINGRK